MTYFIKNMSGIELFKSNHATCTREALTEAVRSGANLGGAHLGGKQWVVQGAVRSDGYAFFLQKLTNDKEPMVKAGCRYFTLNDAQNHWEFTRTGEKLLEETREIVRCMVNLAHIRGFI